MTKKSTWQEFFDAHAPIYEENIFTKNTMAEVDFLLEELSLPPGSAILDVGCGTGRHSIELAKRGYAVVGLDLSAAMLGGAAAAARATGLHVKWIQADATQFSFTKPFDAAICLCEGAFGLLSQEDDPIAQPLSILGNISHSLKPQARVVITVLNGIAMMRRHSNSDVTAGRFDPLALVESSAMSPAAGIPALVVKERAFVPTELMLLCHLAGLRVLHLWGGTAGNWGRRALDLDEIEIMMVAEKIAEPSVAAGSISICCT